MGLSPQQVEALTAWEFGAMLAGYNQATGANANRAPTDEEFAAALKALPDD